MIQKVTAVYEGGVLRPLEPVSLAESQRVKLTISEMRANRTQRDLEFLEWVRAEAATIPQVPSIDEVRSILASIPGSLSEDVIAERGDY